MATRIGIIGVGGFGRYCLEQWRALPEARVTAIAGAHPEKYRRLAAEFHIPHPLDDWRALVRHPEVEVVYLATPPALHAEQAIAALEAGKHVFCEKPLALTVAEADAMLATAARVERRVGINFVMRYTPLFDLLRQITREGLLGAPQRMLLENTAGDLPAEHWFWQPAQSGEIPVEHAVHFLDIAESILGPGHVQWACATRRADGAADKWLLALRYGAQIIGTQYHAFDKPAAIETTWSVWDFERGRIRLDGWVPDRLALEGLVTHEAAARLATLLPAVTWTVFPTPQAARANGGEHRVHGQIAALYTPAPKDVLYADAVRAALRDFLTWTSDPAHTPRVTGADGRRAVELACQAVTRAHTE